MKVLIVDREALAALRPLDVLTYLRDHGWRPFEDEPGAPLSEWSNDGAVGYVEVQVPLHPTWRDYARSMGEVVATIARAEARSQLDLVCDLANVTPDGPRTSPR